VVPAVRQCSDGSIGWKEAMAKAAVKHVARNDEEETPPLQPAVAILVYFSYAILISVR